MIAATVFDHKLTVATLNVLDFERFRLYFLLPEVLGLAPCFDIVTAQVLASLSWCSGAK
jgi:hypothetical protein